ncbi:Bax inhibitor-1 family protein [Candidatus Peribacteria bacterium]|nr:Bax inhibitor-1 family protein [Candidatus Peribacteria bacterium]
MQYSTVTSRPMGLEKSEESQIYALFAVALALTNIGIYIGMQYGTSFLTGGYMIVFLLAELLLIFTSSLWAKATPLNYLFFALFPLLSGFTITPYVMSVLTGYANGGTILMNAFAATVCMAGASAVFAKSTSWNLGVLSKGLFFGLIGLICLGLLQIFVPAFQTTQMELIISGFGVVFFAIFTAYDMQRISHLSRMGANPFMLALSLYLDIFNMFLYVLRFMLVLYGDRR